MSFYFEFVRLDLAFRIMLLDRVIYLTKSRLLFKLAITWQTESQEEHEDRLELVVALLHQGSVIRIVIQCCVRTVSSSLVFI